jgi:hypothetical protein
MWPENPTSITKFGNLTLCAYACKNQVRNKKHLPKQVMMEKVSVM